MCCITLGQLQRTYSPFISCYRKQAFDGKTSFPGTWILYHQVISSYRMCRTCGNMNTLLHVTVLWVTSTWPFSVAMEVLVGGEGTIWGTDLYFSFANEDEKQSVRLNSMEWEWPIPDPKAPYSSSERLLQPLKQIWREKHQREHIHDWNNGFLIQMNTWVMEVLISFMFCE